MTLIDEREVYYEQERKRKMFKNIIKVIIALVVIAIFLLIFMKVKNYGKVILIVDGKEISNISKSPILKNDSGKIYIENNQVYLSVNDISNLLNRDYYNNEYKSRGEDKTKCQIKNGDEYTSLKADSKKIYKAITKTTVPNEVNNESFQEIPENITYYEYFEVANPTKYIDGTIYASTEAINIAFDVDVSYDSKKKTISISSLDYLEKLAMARRSDVVDSSQYSYANKRLLKYGMCVVKGANGNYGIGSYTNSDKLKEYVASCKYSSIQYNEAFNTIDAITNDGKHSILKLNVQDQTIEKTITTNYDDIEVMDKDFKFFKVKSQNSYGIIGPDSNLILANEYEEIGINDGLYTDVTSRYIINNKYIPIKQNGLWGLCNTEGNILIAPRFQEIGCSLAKSGDGVIIIPQAKNSSDAVVFLYDKNKSLYGLYNVDNGEKIAVSLIEVYKCYESGVDNYYIKHVVDVKNPIVHTLNVYKDL